MFSESFDRVQDERNGCRIELQIPFILSSPTLPKTGPQKHAPLFFNRTACVGFIKVMYHCKGKSYGGRRAELILSSKGGNSNLLKYEISNGLAMPPFGKGRAGGTFRIGVVDSHC